jgi:predicted HAD superfamily phosphohydrolase YqeG
MSTLEPRQKPLVLLDLDQTLVDTTSLKPSREARDWTGALAHLNETQLQNSEELNFREQPKLRD